MCILVLILWHELYMVFFCFKQKTAYEMRISDWSSDVCSSDLGGHLFGGDGVFRPWHVINVVEPKPLTIPFLGTKNRLSEKFDSHRVGIVVQKIAAPHGFADLLAEALAEQK